MSRNAKPLRGHDLCSAWQHWGLTALAGILVLGLLAATATAKKPPKPPPEPPDPAVAFFEPGRNWDLMAMNEDGSNAYVILDGAGANPADISWSPDATQLTFNSTVDGPGVYVINVDGTGLRKVTTDADIYTAQPAWSPMPCADGEYKIAFNDDDDVDGKQDIFLVNLDGTGRINLTNTPDLEEHSATWDPTGTRLAIARTRRQVWVLTLGLDAGGEMTVVDEWHVTETMSMPLLTGGKRDIQWARTQDKLVLGSDLDGNPENHDLFIIDLLDPANPTQITFTEDICEKRPTWSSDDSEIAFRRKAPGKKDDGIYAIGPDGTGLRRLRKGDSIAPDWRR